MKIKSILNYYYKINSLSLLVLFYLFVICFINLFCFSEIDFKIDSFVKKLCFYCEQFFEVNLNFKSLNYNDLLSKNYFNFLLTIKDFNNIEKASFNDSFKSIYNCEKLEDLIVTHNKFLSFFPDKMKLDLMLNLHLSNWYKESLNFQEKKIILRYERTLLLHKWGYRHNPNMINEIVNTEYWNFLKNSKDSNMALTFLKIRSNELHEKNLSLNIGSLDNFWIFVTSAIMGHLLGFSLVYGTLGLLGY